MLQGNLGQGDGPLQRPWLQHVQKLRADVVFPTAPGACKSNLAHIWVVKAIPESCISIPLDSMCGEMPPHHVIQKHVDEKAPLGCLTLTCLTTTTTTTSHLLMVALQPLIPARHELKLGSICCKT